MKREFLACTVIAILGCSLAACATDPVDAEGQDPEATSSIASQSLVPGSQSTFQNVNSGMCMGVSGGSGASGALIQQFPCDGRINQKWVVLPESFIPNFRRIQDAGSHLCLGVAGNSTASTANIVQLACDSRTTEQWQPVDGPNFSFKNADGMCIGVNGASTALGAQLKQFPCDGRVNQRWNVQ
jgi:hypothetical protein